ncbi:hypothetical protein [Nonomuraea sp. NPDC049758]|uniref:hypothetical protein n=1 Tax=Nonomuraea sp. NPDC049758 TaxID=3154360 RepID=UPI00342E0837
MTSQHSLADLGQLTGRPRESLVEEVLPGLPVKVHGLLRANGVHTLGDLLDRGETGLAEIPQFGAVALEAVKQALGRILPSLVTPQEAAHTLRGLLDREELFTRLHADGSSLDVRSGRAREFPSGPITHVIIEASLLGPAYVIAPPPLPGRDAGPSRVTHHVGEAVTWICSQTLYPYECLMDCGNPAGVGCTPACQSFPDDRYTPPPAEENADHGGLFADEPPFPDDPWATAAQDRQHTVPDGPA